MSNEVKKLVNDFINRRKEQEEKCIEPFAFLDEDGDVIKENPNKDFVDVMEESTLEIEINEEDILYKEEKDDNIEEIVKEIADEIEPINSDLMIEINEGDKLLIDKVNCNIKHIPLLNSYYVTNKYIEIIQVNMDDTMLNDLDVMLVVFLKYGENYVMTKMKFETLYEKGLIKVIEGWEVGDIEMSNVEYRGLTTVLTTEELGEMVDLNNMVKLDETDEFDLEDIEL